jgi:hypothetical protein
MAAADGMDNLAALGSNPGDARLALQNCVEIFRLVRQEQGGAIDARASPEHVCSRLVEQWRAQQELASDVFAQTVGSGRGRPDSGQSKPSVNGVLASATASGGASIHGSTYLDQRIDVVLSTVEYLHRTVGAVPAVVTLVDSTAAQPYFNGHLTAPGSKSPTPSAPGGDSAAGADLKRAAMMAVMEAAALGGEYSSSKTTFYVHMRLAEGIRRILATK